MGKKKEKKEKKKGNQPEKGPKGRKRGRRRTVAELFPAAATAIVDVCCRLYPLSESLAVPAAVHRTR